MLSRPGDLEKLKKVHTAHTTSKRVALIARDRSGPTSQESYDEDLAFPGPAQLRWSTTAKDSDRTERRLLTRDAKFGQCETVFDLSPHLQSDL